MKLLLQRNVEKLGKIGDVVDVADGYGRNYLLPMGFAVELTPDNLHRFEAMKRKLIALGEETKEKLQLLAKELDRASCTIIVRSTEEGHLYGSVSAKDISKQLATEGFQVEPECVLLENPIKELGIYKVKIRLHPEVESELKVWVVKGDNSLEAARKAKRAAAEEHGEDLDAVEPEEAGEGADEDET
ncbi:MAG: 50S ribosomal protein L9 [Planctomycetota bacterium]